jgi:hypothetical protein
MSMELARIINRIEATKVAVTAAVREAVLTAEATGKQLLTGERTGREYRRGGGRRRGQRRTRARIHRASAKGESPATDYGNLAASMRGAIDAGGMSGRLRMAYYAAYLDDPAGLNRPIVEPILNRVRPILEKVGRAL